MERDDAVGVPRRGVSLADVWVAVALTTAWAVFASGSVAPNDLWWHLRAGEWMLANRSIPRVDLFSYTQFGAPWIYQSWLAQVTMATAHGAGGVTLLVAFGAALNLTGYGLALRAAAQYTGGNLRAAAVAALLGMIVGTPAWQVRPQLFSIAMFGALVAALFSRPQDDLAMPRGMWLLPLGFALWANLHGGFVFGLVLLGMQVASHLWRWALKRAAFPVAWVATGLLSVAATLATPLGAGMGGYVLGFAQHPVTRNLNMEFAPLNARQPVGIVFLVHLTLLIGLWLWRGHRPDVRETLVVLGFGALTLMAVRSVLWYGLATTPLLARAVADVPLFRREREQPGVRWANGALLGLLGLAVVATSPWLRGYVPHPSINPAHPYLGADTPVAAVAELRRIAQPGETRLFHTEAYGSYLIYAAPELPVFVDTRIELYPPEQWHDYLAIISARYDWHERLRGYGVNTLLLDRSRQADLVEAVEDDPRWALLYEDDQAMILVLRDTS